jgi:hypothetical protein
MPKVEEEQLTEVVMPDFMNEMASYSELTQRENLLVALELTKLTSAQQF